MLVIRCLSPGKDNLYKNILRGISSWFNQILALMGA